MLRLIRPTSGSIGVLGEDLAAGEFAAAVTSASTSAQTF